MALKLEKESFELKVQIFLPAAQDKNIFIASGYQGLGRIYYNYQEDKKAFNYINNAIEIIKKTLGPSNLKIANLYEDAGLIKLSQNDYKT